MFSKAEEPDLALTEKLKIFGAVYWRGIVCFLTPIIFIFVLTPFPAEKYQWTAYVLCVMGVYWVTECIPLPITSFFPIIIYPLSGTIGTLDTCKPYFNDTIFMFIGSLILAYSVEQSGLHKRLAYGMVRILGYSHIRLLLSVCICTTFVSMWITNTAATTMMVPINFAILKVFEDQKLLVVYEKTPEGELFASDITTCYFCAATFSATIGGIGTLVGTVTNLVLKGLYTEAYPESKDYLTFPAFSFFTIPVMLVSEIFLFLWLIIVYLGWLRPNSDAAKSTRVTPEAMKEAKRAVNESWVRLGPLSYWEVNVLILFFGAMLAFFCRAPQLFPGWGNMISDYYGLGDYKFALDSSMAALVSFLMFLLPSRLDFFKNFTAKFHEDLPKKPVVSVLDWKLLLTQLPYSFTFLLGGGFVLSESAKTTGLNNKIGEVLQKLRGLPNELILMIVIVVTTIITNFASNVAVCNVITPIAMQLATEIGQHPLWYALASGISASFCFMLPVGTPGNLVVQSAAKIPTMKMIKAGFGPSVTTIIITWVFLLYWAPFVFPDLKSPPALVK